MIERKILFRIALMRALYDQIRPYFFQKYVSNFDPPQYRPKPTPKIPPPPPEGVGGLLAGKKGKSQLVLFLLDSFANRNTWNFPCFPASTLLLPYPDQRTKGWAPYVSFHDFGEICWVILFVFGFLYSVRQSILV